MAEEKNSNKLITIMLAIIICAAAITVLYVSLPQDNTSTDEEEIEEEETPEENETEEPVVLLTLIYNGTENEYTLEELESISQVTDTGRYVKSKLLPDTVLIVPDLNESAWEFTGVAISTIIDDFEEEIPENFNITVTSSDGWTSDYTKDQVDGIIDIYNETGNVNATSGATMILAYKQDGEYITDEEIGPLRIALVGDDIITLSNLWSKMVVSIEIVEI